MAHPPSPRDLADYNLCTVVNTLSHVETTLDAVKLHVQQLFRGFPYYVVTPIAPGQDFYWRIYAQMEVQNGSS